MALARTLLKLWSLRIWVGFGALLAVVAAVVSLTAFHSTVYSSASTQMLVDSPKSALANPNADLTGYIARATVFARLMTSPAAMQYIGRAAGIPGDSIAATGPVEVNGSPNATFTPTALNHGRIASVKAHYTLDFLQNPELPTVDVYAQAPTTRQAIALANGAVSGFSSYVSQLDPQTTGGKIIIRQLGGATGGVVDPGTSKKIAVLVFFGVFLVWCALVLFVTNLFRHLRAARAAEYGARPAFAEPDEALYFAHSFAHDLSSPDSNALREGHAYLDPVADGDSKSNGSEHDSNEEDVGSVRLGP